MYWNTSFKILWDYDYTFMKLMSKLNQERRIISYRWITIMTVMKDSSYNCWVYLSKIFARVYDVDRVYLRRTRNTWWEEGHWWWLWKSNKHTNCLLIIVMFNVKKNENIYTVYTLRGCIAIDSCYKMFLASTHMTSCSQESPQGYYSLSRTIKVSSCILWGQVHVVDVERSRGWIFLNKNINVQEGLVVDRHKCICMDGSSPSSWQGGSDQDSLWEAIRVCVLKNN